jgi:TRAP-type uncharacterized transport system substrate-binding protein
VFGTPAAPGQYCVVPQNTPLSSPRPGWRDRLTAASWRDLALVLVPLMAFFAIAVWLTVKSVRFAPPHTIRFVSGPDGSGYRNQAERYKKIIESYGVKVEILPSRGALDNLQRLADPHSKIDVGFVQGGLSDGIETAHLESLGSVFAQPLMVYARAPEALDSLAALKGKRVAVGPEGSGTRVLALKLLKGNEIEGPPTQLLDIGGEQAAQALIAGTIDAAFLMGDSATPQVMRSLRAVAGIDLVSLRQADAYLRKFRFLSKLSLPEGAMDLAKNYPPRTLQLVGPTVELVAREDLHPALSDLLISAAREIHGGAGLFRNAGDFPAPLARDFRISADAERYYKSGQQFLYKRLPFWLASLVDRLLVLIVPLLVILVPASRILPAIYRWRVRSRIYRWYGVLMAIERDIAQRAAPDAADQVLTRLDEIARAVDDVRTPLSFADQLYVLRDHVAAVRRRAQATFKQS